MKTGNENTPLVALGVAIALVVSAIYVCWKPAVPYVLPGSKEARVTNRVQCNLAQKVKKINPYAAILVKELAWDPSLARAFMVELGGDRYFYRIWFNNREDIFNEGFGNWQSNVGIAQLTTNDVFNAYNLSNGSACLFDLGWEIVGLAKDVKDGRLSIQSFKQIGEQQLIPLDPRFNPDISMGVLVTILRNDASDNPVSTAREFLDIHTKRNTLATTLDKVRRLWGKGTLPRVEFDATLVRPDLAMAVSDIYTFMDRPDWYDGEIARQKEAVTQEQHLYAHAVRYMTARDIQKGINRNDVVPIASKPEIGLVVDKRIGEYDIPHTNLYKTLNPKLWEGLQQFAHDCQTQYDTVFIIREANHSIMYQNKMGSASISGPTGKSVEIQVDGRPFWRWANAKEIINYLLVNKKKYHVDYYTESPHRDMLHLFLVE